MSKKGQVKERRLFYVLLFIGMAAGILKALMIPLPNPLDWITFLFQGPNNVLKKLLE